MAIRHGTGAVAERPVHAKCGRKGYGEAYTYTEDVDGKRVRKVCAEDVDAARCTGDVNGKRLWKACTGDVDAKRTGKARTEVVNGKRLWKACT